MDGGRDWVRVLARLKSLGLSVDAVAGVKTGFAEPEGGAEFAAELERFVPVAHRLGCGQVILLSGPVRASAAAGRQHEAAIETLGRGRRRCCGGRGWWA